MPWDVDTLKEYVERILDEQTEARKIAKAEVDRRLDAMNELRDQIDSERGRYVEREMYDQRHQDLERRVGGVEGRLSNIEGGIQIRAATIGWGLAALAVLIAAIAYFT